MKKNLRLILLIVLTVNLTNCKGQSKSDKKSSKNNIESTHKQILKDSILVSGWYYISDFENGFKRKLDKTEEFYFINPKPIALKTNFKKLEIYETDFEQQSENYCGLTIQLDKIGTKNWAIATEKAIGKKLALIIDNVLVNSPNVNSQITVGITALNRSEYNRKEIEEFKKRLED